MNTADGPAGQHLFEPRAASCREGRDKKCWSNLLSRPDEDRAWQKVGTRRAVGFLNDKKVGAGTRRPSAQSPPPPPQFSARSCLFRLSYPSPGRARPRSVLFGTLGGLWPQNGSPTPPDIIGAATKAPVYTKDGHGRIPCIPTTIAQQSRPCRRGILGCRHNHANNHGHNHAQAVGEAVS